MKKNQHPKEEVEKTMALLDKVQRQSAPPDLSNRILQALEQESKIVPMRIYRKFQLAAACVAVLMLLNAGLLFQAGTKAAASNSVSENSLDTFISDYQLEVPAAYY
ncbi:MAG: hypothetical protein AAFV95_26625 [Bacteroidota bacterium]